MRLIDADTCLRKAWQNFYKHEDEQEKNIDGYDILLDRFYEQSGFECCQQTIVNAPTVEAIPKADYEARLKADMVAMLENLDLQIDESAAYNLEVAKVQRLIRDKINAMKGKSDASARHE